VPLAQPNRVLLQALCDELAPTPIRLDDPIGGSELHFGMFDRSDGSRKVASAEFLFYRGPG